jgi:restriction endonuclease Mrr
MTWAPLATQSVLLVLSALSATEAAAILLRGIVRSKLQKALHDSLASSGQPRSELGSKGRLSSLLDRITLLNKNLIQCPRCSTIDHAHARFCTRCGTSMQSHEEMSTYDVHDIEARYLAQDESTRVYGLSMKVDPQTQIGVLIGIQNRELSQGVNRAQN